MRVLAPLRFNSSNGITNYHRLLAAIERWRVRLDEQVIYVTFNYDRMLEDAFADTLGMAFGPGSSYVGDREHRIFKLHGSVDWGKAVGHRDQFPRGVPDVIDHAAALSESPTIRPFAGINAMHEDQYLVPALAIPTQTKAHFQCPPSDVEALENALPNVDRVLVIGWRGGEQQFLDLWSDRTNSNLAGVVVGGDQQAADAVRAKIEESISGRFRPSAAAGFTPFVDSEEGLVHLLESLGEKDF